MVKVNGMLVVWVTPWSPTLEATSVVAIWLVAVVAGVPDSVADPSPCWSTNSPAGGR